MRLRIQMQTAKLVQLPTQVEEVLDLFRISIELEAYNIDIDAKARTLEQIVREPLLAGRFGGGSGNLENEKRELEVSYAPGTKITAGITRKRN